ncbi:calcium-binding protein, partial [Photorhabdus noenieputensis]
LTSDAQGQMKFSLNGTIYSHDSAASDVFVVAAQPGVKDYKNALRGFRHGIDKIDLRQTGVTDFSQLTIAKSNRGTINGLSQIHGVEVIFNGASGTDSNVKLLYLDTLDISQVDAADFLFAEPTPDLVPTVKPVVTQSLDKPTVTFPDALTPITIPKREPISIPPFELHPTPSVPKIKPAVEPTPVTTDPNSITVQRTFGKVTLGDESKTVNVKAVGVKMVAGNGDNTVNVAESMSNITLGNGNNVIVGDINKLTVGHGNNSITDTGGGATMKVGDGNNHIVTSGTMSRVEVGNGDNHIVTSGTMSKVKVGDGNNNIVTSGTMSTVEVGHGDNDLEFSGDMGDLVFGKDISPERLWFQHEGQDLQISVIGSKQEVTLHNWYASPSERPGSIMAGDGHRLTDRNVENLVQAMAAFAPPTPATTMLGDVEQQRLQPVLAANWH